MPLHPRGEAEQARHVAPPFAPKSLAGTGLAGASAGQAVGPLPPRLYCAQRHAHAHRPNCSRSSSIRSWASAGISISPSVCRWSAKMGHLIPTFTQVREGRY